jgi:hypothetical protein
VGRLQVMQRPNCRLALHAKFYGLHGLVLHGLHLGSTFHAVSLCWDAPYIPIAGTRRVMPTTMGVRQLHASMEVCQARPFQSRVRHSWWRWEVVKAIDWQPRFKHGSDEDAVQPWPPWLHLSEELCNTNPSSIQFWCSISPSFCSLVACFRR